MRKPLMNRLLLTLAVSAQCSAVMAAVTAEITGDNVNLRAAPTNTSEVVGQVSSGEVLEITGAVSSWLRVVPPDRVSLWVFDEFVEDGRVAVSRLQVRAGPGINYTVLGKLDKGGTLDIRGLKGEWREIAPPRGCGLWVNSRYANIQKTPVQTPLKETVSRTDVQRKPPRPADSAPPRTEEPVRAKRTTGPVPRGGDDIVSRVDVGDYIDEAYLLKDVEQGRRVERSGTISLSGVVWRRPSSFRLVNYDKWDRAVTSCYIMGNERYLERLKGKTVYLTGREYWMQGVRYPLVVPDRISIRN